VDVWDGDLLEMSKKVDRVGKIDGIEIRLLPRPFLAHPDVWPTARHLASLLACSLSFLLTITPHIIYLQLSHHLQSLERPQNYQKILQTQRDPTQQSWP
jgi:hypothetical protein